MNTQPEALRLADELDCRGMNRPSWKDQFDAGYELRRLHALNAELLEALKLADAMLSGANMDAKAVERKARAAIAKAEESKG